MVGKTGSLGLSLAATSVDTAEARKISNLEAGDYARISVSDTGTGMDDEILHRVLDPFFTTKGVGSGTGMGLAMVYGIVSNHGGALDISSSPGEGTTVTVYLPLLEESENDVLSGSEVASSINDQESKDRDNRDGADTRDR
jgi:signal transduction histidine kinase